FRSSGLLRSTLDLETAEGMNALGSEAQVGADWDPALDKLGHKIGRPPTTFELDHVCASLHQRRSATEPLLVAGVVRAKGQIRNYPGSSVGRCDASSVIRDVLEDHRDRARPPLQNHPQRVTNEQRMDPCVVEKS